MLQPLSLQIQAISELPENYRTAKRKLREDYQPQISEINQKLLNIKGEIGDLKTALVETGVDVGPAIYLARTFQTDIDTVVKFFIFVLIFVFDPMAVMFIISYNVALEHDVVNKKPVVKKKKRWWEVYGEKKKEEPIYTEEDEERMDIIGQNGNDGIHYEEEPKKKKYIGRGGLAGK